MNAEKAGKIIKEGIEKLEADPEHFRAMNPPNGWGSYDTLLPVLREIRDACFEHPLAEIGSWL